MTSPFRTEPSWLWDQAPIEHPHHVYGQRARQVYWNKNFPACRTSGPSHAECLLNPDHEGDHYGNGYDAYGPKGAFRWKPRRSKSVALEGEK